MKKMLSISLCILFSASVLLVVSCQKKEEAAKPAAGYGDKAATAGYGEKAKDGVILITTLPYWPCPPDCFL